MKKVVVVMDSFKGSLSSVEVEDDTMIEEQHIEMQSFVLYYRRTKMPP